MLLAGVAMLAAGATALAVEPVTVSETVSYRPSQAESGEGAQKLYDRLQHAAARVCKLPGRVIEGQAYRSCADKALATAVKDVNIDAVAAIYLEKNKVADHEGIVTIAKR